MEYTFKTVTEAWSVIYDDLGNENANHDITDFFTSQPRGRQCNETRRRNKNTSISTSCKK